MLPDVLKNKVWDVGGWQKPGGYNTYQRWRPPLTLPLVASEQLGNTPATWGVLYAENGKKKSTYRKVTNLNNAGCKIVKN